jgi:hypothetical protein
MKKIGEGYYYNVYNLGNGRVLKKLKNKFGMFWFIVTKNIWWGTTFSEYNQATNNIPNIILMYKELQKRIGDEPFLGNPIFQDGLSYEQDKAVVVEKFLKTASVEESKKLIDQYALFIKKLWEYGIYEKSWNFTINNGINNHGNVILIDFNEVSFDLDHVKEKLESKRYTRTYSRSSLKEEVRDYYDVVMEREMTLQNLDYYWNKSMLK